MYHTMQVCTSGIHVKWLWTMQVRGTAVRKRLQMQRDAAVRIQAQLRCVMYRRRFVAQRRAAVVVQAHVRCWSARFAFLEKKAAALMLEVNAVSNHLH
jgi:hypothetical protein